MMEREQYCEHCEFCELNGLDAMRREFSANVSHELKTPITSIAGFAEMIESGMVESPEDCRLFAGRIVRESSRLLALVEDIMHLSRLDEESFPDLTPCSLAEVAEECIQFLRPLALSAEVTLRQEGAAPPPILGHRALLRELVQNLCENAIKYNHPGGHVWVKLDCAGDYAVLEVADDGIGIAPEHLDRIFQRFYRVDKSRSKQTGGTGLGLSIAKHITEQHKGTIAVRSQLGAGTAFAVSLPLASPGDTE
ncbi:MAG: ATP-binding protein [Angelakisella sp.]